MAGQSNQQVDIPALRRARSAAVLVGLVVALGALVAAVAGVLLVAVVTLLDHALR